MLRAGLLYLSESKRLRGWLTHWSVARRMSRRFVAGEELDEAVAAARASNEQGMTVSLDYLGENVKKEGEARAAQAVYLRMLDRIHAEGLRSNVSLKLTQLGLDLGDEFAKSLVQELVQRAESQQNFVRIDMEGSRYTQRTLDLFKALRASSEVVGIVIQAYLYRSEQDVRDLLSIGARIRLCKGAYKEPPEIAFPHKRDVDRNFVRLMQILLSSGIYHGIATHDPRMIEATIEYAAKQSLAKESFEFQMLYGIRRELQRQLVQDGYRMRVYIPFGGSWYPYLMRRLAERPANLLFFVRSVFAR